MEKQISKLHKKNNSEYERETSETFALMEEKVETISKVLKEKDISIHELENKFKSMEKQFEKKNHDLEKSLKQQQQKLTFQSRHSVLRNRK